MKVIYLGDTNCQQNPNFLFIYGEQDISSGISRACSNSIGIPINNLITSFYSDDKIEDNKDKINTAIAKIIEKASHYECIVFPSDGFGTGLSQLSTKAPLTFIYLNEAVKNLILQLIRM